MMHHVMIQEATLPQLRKYKTRSEQQAAYRLRVKRSLEELVSLKNLPSLPAVPTIPGTHRWRAMLASAQLMLETVAQEMIDYYEDRSQQWQESEKGDDFLMKHENLQECISQLQNID